MSTRTKKTEVVDNVTTEQTSNVINVDTTIKRIKLINKLDKLTGVIQFTGSVSVTIDTDIKVQKMLVDEDGVISYVIVDSNTFTMPFSVLLACLHNNCKQVLIQPIVTYYLGKLVEKSTNDIGLELSMLLQDSKCIVSYETKTLDANKTVDEEHVKITYGINDIVFIPKSLEKAVTVFNHLFKGMDIDTAAKVARKQLRLGDEPEFLV